MIKAWCCNYCNTLKLHDNNKYYLPDGTYCCYNCFKARMRMAESIEGDQYVDDIYQRV